MMKNKYEWVNHFKIQQDKIVELQRSLGAQDSLVHVCIEQGLLDENEYIKWAKNYYKIPTLKATFFDQPMPSEFINKYSGQFPKFTLPVLDNEGTIYVACLEPVEGFQFPQPIQWVLAPYSKMKNWMPQSETAPKLDLEIDSFDSLKKVKPSEPEIEGTYVNFVINGAQNLAALQEQKQSVAPVAPAPVAPPTPVVVAPVAPPTPVVKPVPEPVKASDDGMIDFSKMDLGETKIGSVPVENKSDNPFHIKLDEASEEDSFSQSFSIITPMSSLSEEAAPEGLSIPESFSVTGVTETPVAAAPTVPVEPVKTEVPAGLNLKIDTPIETPAGLDINFNPEEIKINFTEAPKMPEMPTEVPQNVKTTSSNPSLSAKMIREDVVNQTMAVTPPPPPKDEHQDLPELDHAEVAKQTLNKDAPDIAFSQMKTFFSQSMILLFEDQQLKPWKHDGNWHKAVHMSDLVDLTTPSIFRIVTETRKPYHGHVIQNPINDSFFNAWNKGMYPEHITMCPLLVQNKLVGMLLGGTTKDKAKNVKLETIERISAQLAAELQTGKKAA